MSVNSKKENEIACEYLVCCATFRAPVVLIRQREGELNPESHSRSVQPARAVGISQEVLTELKQRSLTQFRVWHKSVGVQVKQCPLQGGKGMLISEHEQHVRS